VSAFTQAELLAYDKFWDGVRVEKTLQYDSFVEGREEGLEEGLAKGRAEGEKEAKEKMALNLLSLGVPLDKIVQASGLSKSDIEKLKDEA